MRVALNSWADIATGIGSESRWLWNMLPFAVWLQAEHPILGWGDNERRLRLGDVLRHGVEEDGWLTGSPPQRDITVCVERMVPAPFAGPLVAICNPECAGGMRTWLKQADTVIARTNQAQAHLTNVMGLENVVRCDVPIDEREFPFRERDRIRNVVFSNGWGGTHDRKGWPEVLRMLRIDPACFDLIYSQRHIDWSHIGHVTSSWTMYQSADLMVVPSRFEGLGLTVLEAMASGCVVMATDAEPMREFMRRAYGEYAEGLLIPVDETRMVRLSNQEWPSSKVRPDEAVRMINRVRRMDKSIVRELSQRGRRYIEDVHGSTAAERLWSVVCSTSRKEGREHQDG